MGTEANGTNLRRLWIVTQSHMDIECENLWLITNCGGLTNLLQLHAILKQGPHIAISEGSIYCEAGLWYCFHGNQKSDYPHWTGAGSVWSLSLTLNPISGRESL